jgi:hypothetical protein
MMDKTRFSGTMRTNYNSGIMITQPFHPPIPAKPNDGQHAQNDLESIYFRTSQNVQLTRVVGVFHCYNINETLD